MLPAPLVLDGLTGLNVDPLTTGVLGAVRSNEKSVPVLLGKCKPLHELWFCSLCTGVSWDMMPSSYSADSSPLSSAAVKEAEASFFLFQEHLSGSEAVSNMVCHLAATTLGAVCVSGDGGIRQ